MISNDNQMLNAERFDNLYSMNYLSLAMLDALKQLKYDKFYEKLLVEIKGSLETFIDHLLGCLEQKTLNNKQTKLKLIQCNNQLLKSYEMARHKYLYGSEEAEDYTAAAVSSAMYYIRLFIF